MTFKWRKLNTLTTTYVSTYPAGVWRVKKLGKGSWEFARAANDGDEYLAVGTRSTAALAQQAAQEWSPE